MLCSKAQVVNIIGLVANQTLKLCANVCNANISHDMELVSSIVEDFNDTSIMDFKSRYFSSTQISLVFNLSIFF